MSEMRVSVAPAPHTPDVGDMETGLESVIVILITGLLVWFGSNITAGTLRCKH